jgi:hypothetical protein
LLPRGLREQYDLDSNVDSREQSGTLAFVDVGRCPKRYQMKGP